MVAERSETAHKLRDFVSAEIEKLKSGEIQRLSSINELSRMFGYVPNKGGAIRALKFNGLDYLRETAISEAIDNVIANGQPLQKGAYGRERVAALVAFAKKEVERFNAGEVESISTLMELAKRFGYAETGGGGVITKVLQRAGLSEARRLARETALVEVTESEIVIPSKEWAWMLGVLSAGAYLRPGKIQMTSADDQLLRAFKTNGEALFKRNAHVGSHQSFGRDLGVIEFNDLSLTNHLGDLRRRNWPGTVKDRHMWILQSQEYTWAFLGAIFDKSGNINTRPEYREIRILTSYQTVASFVIELLDSVNIENSRIIPRRNTPEGIIGVSIHNIEDIKTIASNIHSVIAAKESNLDFFRKLNLRKSRPYPDKDLIIEWMRIRDILGHSPSSTELKELRVQGQTEFDSRIYRRFGGDYSQAREILERIALTGDSSFKSANQ